MKWTKITKNNLNDAAVFCSDGDYCIFEEFVKRNEIIAFKKEIRYGTTVLRFFQNGGKSCGKNELTMQEKYGSRFVDHYMFYKNKNGDVIFSSQPYLKSESIRKEFNKKFDENYNLKIFDSKKSWYAPGKTTLFTITLKNVIIID